jgi:hypothetical protein
MRLKNLHHHTLLSGSNWIQNEETKWILINGSEVNDNVVRRGDKHSASCDKIQKEKQKKGRTSRAGKALSHQELFLTPT